MRRFPLWTYVIAAALAARTGELVFASPGPFSDTAEYARQARYAPWDRLVLAGPRPPGTAWWMILTGHNDRAFVIGQTLLAIACWGVLIYGATGLFRNPKVQAGVGLALAAFSLTSAVTVWDSNLLSDSLSLSLMVAATGLLLVAVDRGITGRLAAGIAALGFLAAMVRDTNGQVLFALGLLLLVGVLCRLLDRRWLLLTLAFSLTLAAGLASAATGHRSRAQIADEVLLRVIPDEGMRSFYVAHGMPDASRIAGYRGAAGNRYFAYRNDPQLADFRRWSEREGLKTQLAWAASDLGQTVGSPFREPSAATAAVDGYYRAPGYRSPLPGVAERLIRPVSRPLIYGAALLALVATGAVAVRRRGHRTGAFVAGATMVVLSLAQVVLVWNSEAMEVPRHGLPLDLGLRLGVLLIAAAVVELSLGDKAIAATGSHSARS